MATVQQADYLSESHDLVSKKARRSTVAIWVYLLSVVLLVGFFGLSLQETGMHLTIVTVLYFLGSSALLILLFRLVIGRLLTFDIRVVTTAENRASDQDRLRSG
jgi:hypothetical protein